MPRKTFVPKRPSDLEVNKAVELAQLVPDFKIFEATLADRLDEESPLPFRAVSALFRKANKTHPLLQNVVRARRDLTRAIFETLVWLSLVFLTPSMTKLKEEDGPFGTSCWNLGGRADPFTNAGVVNAVFVSTSSRVQIRLREVMPEFKYLKVTSSMAMIATTFQTISLLIVLFNRVAKRDPSRADLLSLWRELRDEHYFCCQSRISDYKYLTATRITKDVAANHERFKRIITSIVYAQRLRLKREEAKGEASLATLSTGGEELTVTYEQVYKLAAFLIDGRIDACVF